MGMCVAIEVGDDGAVSVGIVPPELIRQYAKDMQPAQSVEDALGTVRDLLTGQTGEQAQAEEQGELPGAPDEAEQAFARGFERGPKRGAY